MELMVTVVVLAIMAAIAIPDFTSSIQSNNIYSISNKLINSLNYARSEAIKRNVPVSVCAAANTSFNSCGSNWNLGWIVFVNSSGGTSISAPILRIENNSKYTSTITTGINIATYNGSGFAATGTANSNFVVKATGCTGMSGKNIAISFTGRANMTEVSCP